MFTALARFCRAAAIPALAGLTSSRMSRRPPARRAVTVAPPAPDVTATPGATSIATAGGAGPGRPGAGAGEGWGADFFGRRPSREDPDTMGGPSGESAFASTLSPSGRRL